MYAWMDGPMYACVPVYVHAQYVCMYICVYVYIYIYISLYLSLSRSGGWAALKASVCRLKVVFFDNILIKIIHVIFDET